MIGKSGAEFNFVGKATRRKDAVARVTGQERYSIDVSVPRMLHGRYVASPYAHARIKSIDAHVAEEMGATVLTWADIPRILYNERIITVPWALHKDHFVLADKVRRMGEPVAAVASETEELAEQAARAVIVQYEPLPVVTDPLAAMQPGVEPIHESVMHGENLLAIENNVACARTITQGDVTKAWAEAEVFVEGNFTTPKIYHMQLEPKTAVCRPEPDGGLTVWATTQSIHNVRIILGQLLDIPLSKLDVQRVPVGGTFGSSIQMNSVIPICAALALKARRPVKMSLTREEDMHDHSKYPTQIHLELAARKDGTLLGARMNLMTDIGAHIVQGYSFLGTCAGWLMSLYRIPNLDFVGQAVYTNKAPSCAMQGFGNPQVSFAVESLMDELALKLDLDPIELRLRNYVGLGDTFWGQGPLVKSVVRSDGVPELLTDGAERFGWHARAAAGRRQGRGSGPDLLTLPPSSGRYRRGWGMARGFHTSSAGAPQPGDVIDFSGAMVKINQDGSVNVVTALMDHGGGTLEAMAKIVAEALCVPLNKVNLAPGSTRTTVYDVVTHATRGVYAGGGAVLKAALRVREDVLATAARYLNVQPEALELRTDEAQGQGVIYAPAMPEKTMTIGELATRCWTDSWKTIASVESFRPVNCPPAYVSIFVEIEVDTWTGHVRTERVVMGSDCGTVINPEQAAGQLEGGLSKGMGYALLEDAGWDEFGQLRCKGYLIDSKVPGISESPCLASITTHFAHTYEPTGPFGAKGIGEAATNPVAAAYANAIRNAIGVRFYELPITPEKILAALSQQSPGQAQSAQDGASPDSAAGPAQDDAAQNRERSQ